MPGNCVHYYFAEKLIDKLSIGSASVVALYPDAYRVGALGADVLDDMGRLPAEMDITDAFALFNDSAAYIFSSGLKSQLSYMLGMLTHYILDSRLNPYVMYLVEHGAPHYYDEGRTNLTKEEIEIGLDYYVARAFLADKIDEIRKFKVRDLVAKDIAELYKNALSRTVRHAIDENKIKNCLEKLDLREKPPVDMLNIDYMNTCKREWTTIRNGEWVTDMSLEECLEKIEPITLKLIDEYMARARSSIELNPKAFYVGFTGIYNK